MNGSSWKTYVRIMRPDHWIKQLFILPGIAFALFLIPSERLEAHILDILVGFFSTCMIASANYVINEWLDRDFDRFHPEKKHRSIVEHGADPRIVYALYGALTALGLGSALYVGKLLFFMELWLWVMGILYNVKPFRMKDIPYVDVLSESLNNAIRLLIGWFTITDSFLPPVSLLLGYWFAGAFLMATKRFSEYRMIGDPELAGQYRKSFRRYTEMSLLLSSFFYAMCSILFLGIILIKYNVNLVLMLPFMIGLFCYYFRLSFQKDSAAQKPEKLIREKGLMIYVILLIALMIILLYTDMPLLQRLSATELIAI